MHGGGTSGKRLVRSVSTRFRAASTDNCMQVQKRCNDLQVVGLLGIIVCALVPAVGMPAWDAFNADPNVEHRGPAAGFQKSAMWGEIKKE